MCITPGSFSVLIGQQYAGGSYWANKGKLQLGGYTCKIRLASHPKATRCEAGVQGESVIM